MSSASSWAKVPSSCWAPPLREPVMNHAFERGERERRSATGTLRARRVGLPFPRDANMLQEGGDGTLGFSPKKPRFGQTNVTDVLERMRSNSFSGWSVADVEKVCREFGVRCAPPSGGGSHYKVSHASQREILTVPFRRPIKPVYIRKLVRFIDAVRDANAKA